MSKPEDCKLRKLLLLGGGGHCHSVIDSLLSMDIYNEIGILDSTDTSWLGISVVGTDDDLPKFIKSGWNEAFITVGSVGNTVIRRKLYKIVKEYGLTIPTIIDPTAVIAKGTKIQEGTFVGKRVVINSGSAIGVCSIINTGAIIEHDCLIGNFSHVSPGTILCGKVSVGADSHVGAGTVVRQLVNIGEHVLIGAGSVVVKDIPDCAKAYGNPCKVIR